MWFGKTLNKIWRVQMDEYKGLERRKCLWWDARGKGLNEKQQEAVKTIDGAVLVISGPGSGKTKCLTHRVAWMISKGIDPVHILAITFTNKASGEMKERIKKLLGATDKKSEVPMPTI